MTVQESKTLRSITVAMILMPVSIGIAQQSTTADPASGASTPMTGKQGQDALMALVGKWKGTCRTWFQPGRLADESEVSGEFMSVFDGSFVKHTYEGSMKGKPRKGEELLAFNEITQQFQSSWVDDFHMSYAIMFAEGKATDTGFEVHGEYDVGDGQPRWGWRTEFEFVDQDHITITAYNIAPEGPEAKAVEVQYARVK